MVRFHPERDLDLRNRNIADLKGDVNFICAKASGTLNIGENDTWISQFDVEFWNDWGTYSPCVPVPTPGGGQKVFCAIQDAAVGRMLTMYGVIDHDTQRCNAEDPLNVGYWLATREAGFCGGDAGDGGDHEAGSQCTWRVRRRVKSVHIDCLRKSGLLEECKKDLQPASQDDVGKHARALIDQAFDGLCPDVGAATADKDAAQLLYI